MAEQETNADETHEGGDNDTRSRSLEDFVTEHYEQQKNDGKLDATEDIDDERASNFFQRALSESRRMDDEVMKSKKKLEKLHRELGSENIAAWQAEHIAETLSNRLDKNNSN